MTNGDNITRKIVLTGGPGGGKSTAADLIRRELGSGIVVVPEAATLLFSGGFPRYDEVGAKVAAQKAIYHLQTNIEDVQHARYPGRTLLCDRGTIDGLIYWPEEKEPGYFESVGTSLEKEFKRYDAVIFFESAAAGDISTEGTNRVRTEDTKTAIALDHGLREIWSKHPQFTHIPHQSSFFEKLQKALEAMSSTLSALEGGDR